VGGVVRHHVYGSGVVVSVMRFDSQAGRIMRMG
jgi:hypothetical protein